MSKVLHIIGHLAKANIKYFHVFLFLNHNSCVSVLLEFSGLNMAQNWIENESSALRFKDS